MDDVQRDRALLREIENAAAAITERAGQVLLERFRQPLRIEFKDENRRDPVTEVDRAVEKLVRDDLARAFPDHGFLGEEGPSDRSSSELLWVLDPLDGTANFAGGLPLFGVSLALLRNGAPVVGCIFVPLGPTSGAAVIRASYGNGTRVGDQTMRVDQDEFIPSRPVALPPGISGMFRLRSELAKRPGEARNLGSICHELAMVAGGGFRYAVFAGPRVWDVAAGILLVREAGGIALTWERGAWRQFDRFVPPRSRKKKPATLRDWARPILVGAPSAIRFVTPHLEPRRPPPLAIRWLLMRRRATARWWRKLRQPELPATQST